MCPSERGRRSKDGGGPQLPEDPEHRLLVIFRKEAARLVRGYEESRGDPRAVVKLWDGFRNECYPHLEPADAITRFVGDYLAHAAAAGDPYLWPVFLEQSGFLIDLARGLLRAKQVSVAREALAQAEGIISLGTPASVRAALAELKEDLEPVPGASSRASEDLTKPNSHRERTPDSLPGCAIPLPVALELAGNPDLKEGVVYLHRLAKPVQSEHPVGQGYGLLFPAGRSEGVSVRAIPPSLCETLVPFFAEARGRKTVTLTREEFLEAMRRGGFKNPTPDGLRSRFKELRRLLEDLGIELAPGSKGTRELTARHPLALHEP